MRKLLTLLLVCTLLLPASGAFAGALSVEDPGETVRPGKATVLAFNAPAAGKADIQVMDDREQVLSVVALSYDAVAGRNELWWNGTYQGIAAPEGTYALTVRLGGETASVPITIGDWAPYLTSISAGSAAVTPDAPLTVSYFASVDGTITWGVWVDSAWRSLGSRVISAGAGSVSWDGAERGAALPDGAYAFTLTLTDASGFDSNEEHVNVTLSGFGAGAMTPALSGAETDPAASADTPSGEDASPDAAPDEIVEEVLLEDPPEISGEATATDALAADNDQRQYTPSYGSPYAGQDASVNYWTLPMDITDEEAVWNMLMAPITVIDGNEKTQVVLYAEPDENSEGVGVVTRSTQGVHVLETLDNGWSLVEAYSSSFHDSKVKKWNMLVQGYVKTSSLKEKKPSDEYGIVIDKLTQRLYLFKDGKLFTTLLVSTGLSNERQPYNETRSGEFLLTSAVGEFASDNLACSMAIRFNDGDLLHEVPHTKLADGSKNYKNCEPKLGTKASHGCIRVQRKRTPEGVSMQWLWNNRAKNAKIVIWEDWQGRQIPIPDGSTTLYYNPAGGQYYHSQASCYSVKNNGVGFEAFTYDQLDQEPYASLERCEYCTPPLRVSEINAINEVYAPGGDHDPVLTAAREKTE